MAFAISKTYSRVRAVLFSGVAVFLSACSGKMVAEIAPGTFVEVGGIPFSVTSSSRGLTVRNFETGATSPASLLTYAGIAAEHVSGCSLTNITKETGVNTYYAAVSCPTA